MPNGDDEFQSYPPYEVVVIIDDIIRWSQSGVDRRDIDLTLRSAEELGLRNGTHRLRVFVRDSEGSQSTEEVEFEIVPVGPPTGELQINIASPANPSTFSQNAQIPFIARVGNATLPLREVTVTLGNRAVYSQRDINNERIEFFILPASRIGIAPGEYELRIEVEDSEGKSGEADAKVIIEGPAPTGELQVTITGPSGDMGSDQPIIIAGQISGGTPPYMVSYLFNRQPIPGVERIPNTGRFGHDFRATPASWGLQVNSRYAIGIEVTDSAGKRKKAETQIRITGREEERKALPSGEEARKMVANLDKLREDLGTTVSSLAGVLQKVSGDLNNLAKNTARQAAEVEKIKITKDVKKIEGEIRSLEQKIRSGRGTARDERELRNLYDRFRNLEIQGKKLGDIQKEKSLIRGQLKTIINSQKRFNEIGDRMRVYARALSRGDLNLNNMNNRILKDLAIISASLTDVQRLRVKTNDLSTTVRTTYNYCNKLSKDLTNIGKHFGMDLGEISIVNLNRRLDRQH